MSEETEHTTDNLNSSEEEKESLLADSESSSTASSRSPSPDHESEPSDPRFAQPPVSHFKRTCLLLFLSLLFWLAFSMRGNLLDAKKKAKIIHASRLVVFLRTTRFSVS